MSDERVIEHITPEPKFNGTKLHNHKNHYGYRVSYTYQGSHLSVWFDVPDAIAAYKRFTHELDTPATVWEWGGLANDTTTVREMLLTLEEQALQHYNQKEQ